MKKTFSLMIFACQVVVLSNGGFYGSSCLGAEATPASPVTPFAIGGDAQTWRDLSRWVPQMQAIGLHALRMCPIEQMDYAIEHHMEFGGLLWASPPAGDTQDKAGGFPVKDIPAWSAYCSQTIKQYQGKAQWWEVWNEPPNFSADTGTAENYAKLMVAAYDAAKAVDPTCKVGMAAKSVHINYLENAIKAGARGHFDLITLHPYETLGCAICADAEPIYMAIVPTVRKMLAAQDPANINVPIYFTELGTTTGQGIDVQAHFLIKAYTMGIAQGVAQIVWFESMDGDSGPMGLLEASGKPRPAYTAMGQMIKYLGQHPAYLGWVLFNDKDYGFVFQGAQGTVLITWAPWSTRARKTSDSIDFGQPVEIVNPLTGEATTAGTYALTDAPIFIVGVPEALVARAKANKAKAFPWGGDYSRAQSVSVTMDGEKVVENGLHTQAGGGAIIARDVIAYGGGARVGGLPPGGNIYMVDPNFLSYTSTPIEISVVCRRNPANDPANIRIRYEAAHGDTPFENYKNTSYYQIPDNEQWHTAKWRIDDSQFVSFWGYSFSMDAGSAYVKSVTVTKLDR
jgi:hypothetical protein